MNLELKLFDSKVNFSYQSDVRKKFPKNVFNRIPYICILYTTKNMLNLAISPAASEGCIIRGFLPTAFHRFLHILFMDFLEGHPAA
jgi:hypothetical protein